MGELIAHLFGDYVLQNHWMALNKTKSNDAAALHAMFYTLPFLFLTRNPWALAIICGTHYIIDRTGLAKKWPAFWGVGEPGWVLKRLHEWRRDIYVDVQHYRRPQEIRLGYFAAEYDVDHPLPESAPPWLGVWLGIIVDNTLHLTINHLALGYFG